MNCKGTTENEDATFLLSYSINLPNHSKMPASKTTSEKRKEAESKILILRQLHLMNHTKAG
jgi:hypothetical protein